MKKNMANKTVHFSFLSPTLLALSLFFFLFSFFSFLACENPVGGGGGGGGSSHPFKAGLGPLVDTRPPTIYLESPDPGDYLPGKYSETTVVNFRGWAEDENEVKAVYLKVTSVQYEGENFLSSYTRVNVVKGNDSQGRIIWLWDLNIDTLRFPNGEFKIKLRVDDGVWPSVETNEITFFINNDPPEITVTSPRIEDGRKTKQPGEVGSDYLNYDTAPGEWPSFPFGRQKSKENFLSGLIRDNEGIYNGQYDEAAKRYPPQIRFWPIKLNNGDEGYRAGVLPPDSAYPWKNIKGLLDGDGNIIGQLIPAGTKGFAFSYRLPKEPGFYGFEIRAQNRDGRTNAHYPRSYYPANYDFTANAVNSYVILYVSPENEVPKVELYRLEDLGDFWSNGAPNYTDLAGITDNEPHPYINANNVNKRGPFTLRVKAWHTEGIKTAAVYWVNEDTGERGRFIWDTATQEKASDEGWTAAKGVSAGNNYTEWGYGETADNKIRSFIFTYNHYLSDDRVPTAGVNPLVSGATRVQMFKGTDDAWDTLRVKNELAQEEFKDSWANMTGNLQDGVYRLEIFATGGSSDMNTPFTTYFRLDTVVPTVVITGVDGAYDTEEVINPRPGGGRIPQYTVNGVVQPKMRFTDEDSRLRRKPDGGYGGSDAYFDDGENEQFFVLVHEDKRVDFDGYIQTGTNNKWWWPIDQGTTLTMPSGVVPIKDGKILRENNAFKIKTSPIYTGGISGKTDTTASSLDDPVDADIALPDGIYWIYVFCRDNAFNVGHASIPLKIDAKTDLPKIDLSAINEDVQDPNVEADNTKWGFVLNGQTRNRITENSSIVLNIKDDDSLGFGGSNSSKTEIIFTRAVYSGDKIDYSEANNVALSQDQIETVFGGPMRFPPVEAAIKSRRGVITQEILTEAIRNSSPTVAAGYGLPDPGMPKDKILPDGMYRFTITVEDYSNLKTKMDNSPADPDPDKAKDEIFFWIVVDSSPPEWRLDTDADNGGRSATNDEYVRLDGNDPPIKGKVWDKNGPVTIVSYKVYNINGSVNDLIEFTYDPLARVSPPTDRWLSDFMTHRNLNKQSGRFRFEIIFEDRFGIRGTFNHYLQVDDTPPEARINTKISTFERDYEDASTGLNLVTPENRKRLANGVLNFSIGATDPNGGKVAEVKWWLVAGDNTAAPPGKAEYNGAAYTSVRSGTLISEFGRPQYIDTLDGPLNGVYTLFVMAKDSADNISENTDNWQTIYLLQEHDRPYFYPPDSGARLIAPDSPIGTDNKLIAANAVVRRNALVTGQITDDDGFFNTDNSVRPGSVRIWVSDKDPAAGFNINNDTTWAASGFESVTYGTAPFTGGLSRANPSVLNISVNLRNLFPGKPDKTGKFDNDGPKYYIIEAFDSGANKYTFTDESNAVKPETVSTTRTRSKLFGFMYDNNPPVIKLTYPVDKSLPAASIKTFGPNAADDDEITANFHLTGTMSDANLKQITEKGSKSSDPSSPNYASNYDTLDDTVLYYYFEYYLDTNSSARKKYLLKGAEITNDDVDNFASTGIRTVAFEVKASDFCYKDNLNFDGIPSSNATHTLTLIAYDKSENTGYYSFNFIKDTKPPDLRIVVPANTKLLPLIDDPAITGGKRDWWYDVSGLPGTQQQTWYKSRRAWEMLEVGGERVNKLPVINYSNGLPQLRVTFNDDTSNIDQLSLKYWIDGDPVSRTATTPVIDSLPANWGKTVNWTINLTTIEGGSIPLADGIHTISFEIKDAVGNTLFRYFTDDIKDAQGNILFPKNSNIYYGFRINSGLPTITVDPPPHSVYGVVTTVDTAVIFSIPNIIAEGANLQNAQLRIKYPDNTPGEWKWLQADDGEWFFTAPNMEKLSWEEYKITRGMLLSLGGVLRGGNYELELKAVGLDGKGSEPSFIWQFTIDTGGPTLVLNDFPADAKLADTVPPADLIPNRWNGDPSKVKVFTSPSQRLQGLISDEHSNLVNAQILIQKFDYITGTWREYYKKDSDTAGTWEVLEVWNELLITSPVAETTKEKIIDQELSKISGITDGLYRARLRARDSAYISGTTTWISPIPATADGHPVYSDYYYFFYAPTVPEITGFTRRAGSLDPDNRTLFSAVVANGTLTFTGNATSKNGYKDMTVTIQRTGQADRNVTITEGKPGAPPWSPVWQWTAALPNFPQLPSDDGAYTLVFTVTDWAGRSSSSRRQITLDNTPPTGEFTAPELLPKTVLDLNVGGNAIFKFASDTFYGGEDAKIKGIAEDKNGLKGIWYHLGYTQNVVAGGNAAAPTKTQVIQTVLTTAADDIGGDENNDAFDAAAKATGTISSAWFKYTTDAAEYPPPPHFTIASSLLYEWELAVKVSGANDLGTYTKDNFTLKGRQYNGGANRTMAHRVNEASVPAAYRKTGLYSIPLWIRVADEAGNVSYFQQDIWVYPNGDYPTNAFINPSAKLTPQGDNNSSVMGGTISVDGMASDNVNVRNVIYRVRADNIQSSASTWSTAVPDMDHLIRPSSGATPFDGSGDQAAMLTLFTSGSPSGQQTVNYPTMTAADSTGWYLATVEGSDSIAKSKAWSFYINANNEFTTKGADGYSPIEKWGFKSSSSLVNDMIRVYVEVLVFDGKLGTNAYNFMSLGENAATTRATPDILVFYLSSSAPEITNRKLSNVGAVTSAMANVPTDNASYTSGIREYESSEIIGKTRSGRFAVQMRMEGKGKTLKRVSVSLPSEAGQNGNIELAQYRDAWLAGENKNLPGIKFARVDTPGTFFTPPNNAGDFIMYYGFDTALKTADIPPVTPPFESVMQGNWANSGGKYAIEVRLYDVADSVTSYRIEVGIDNFAPVADMKTVISNGKAAGTNQTFMGRAYDYWGTNSNAQPGYYSVDKVYAWFTKDPSGTANYVNLNTKGTSATPPPLASIPAWGPANAREATFSPAGSETVSGIDLPDNKKGTLAARSYPRPGTREITLSGGRTETIETGTEWVKVISEAEAAVASNRMYWQPITAGRSILWSFIQDTTVLPDGPIYLNYIVVDSAGNASLYQQKMVIMNNYPRITDVTLYTNNIGQGAAFTKEGTSDYIVPASMPAGYLNTGFISKNRYIGFKVAASSGNGNLHYRIQYVKRDSVKLTNPNLLAIAADAAAASRTWSNIYAIKEKGNMGDAMWATLMGKPREMVTPEKGMHFAFKATALDIGTTSADTAEVWRYTLTTTPVLQTPTVTQAQGVAVDDQITGNFRFINDNFDLTNTNRINEKLGSRPDRPDKPASPVTGVTYNDPDDTAFFLIKVWDSVNPDAGNPATAGEDEQLYDAVAVGMNVYLQDLTNPTARLYDLNPYTELDVTGNNIGEPNKQATINNAADPIAIGSNIVRGGLFNTNTMREPVKSGYIDPRGGSLALKPMIQNDDGDWVTPDYPLLNPADGPDGVIAGSANDKASGRVILRGLAWDDQLIDTVSITIGPTAGGGTKNTILKLNTGTGKMGVCITPADGGNAANAGRVFFAEELHWKTGHVVEWAYVWDTEAEPASLNRGPGTVRVEVTVTDKNGPRNNTAVPVPDNYSTNTFHSWVNVDVVPYITGFERNKAPGFEFTTKRSLQGWYSFYRGETGIKVKGYNFGTTSGGVTMSLGSVGLTVDAGTSSQERTFSIPNAATSVSGAITLRVTTAPGTDARNNNVDITTIANSSWNSECNAFTPGSDLWINRPYAHIWRSLEANGDGTVSDAGAGTVFADLGSKTSAQLDSPGMSLQYTGNYAGRLHGVWTTYSRESLFYAQNHNVKGSANGIQVRNNADLGGNGYGGENRGTNNYGLPGSLLLVKSGEPYSGGDIDYYNGAGNDDYFNNTSVVAAYQRDGGPWLILKPRLTSIVFHNNANANGDGGGTDTSYSISREQPNLSTYRWKNTRIKKMLPSTNDNNPGKVFVTAYDSTYKRLFFKTVNGAITASAGGQDNNGGTDMYLDGGSALTGGVTYSGSIGAATGGAGNWSALDYGSDGFPVVAYFDEQHQTLRLAYAGSATPTAGNNWTVRYVLPTTHVLHRGSGSYVSMKIDHNNRIHLAFYNSNNKAVVYATSAAKDGLFTAYVIDPVVEGGQWTDISVDSSGNPWIVYADATRKGNRDGARLAYRSYSGSGAVPPGAFSRALDDSYGNSIQGWEAMTMPANYRVNDDRLNVAAWPPTGIGANPPAVSPIGSWNAAVGYASDLYRIGYFFKPGNLAPGF